MAIPKATIERLKRERPFHGRTREQAVADARSYLGHLGISFKEKHLKDEALRITLAEHPDQRDVVAGSICGSPIVGPEPLDSFNGWKVGDEFEWNAWAYWNDDMRWVPGYHPGWSEGDEYLKATIVRGSFNHHFEIETIRPWTKGNLKTTLRFPFGMFLDEYLIRRLDWLEKYKNPALPNGN